MCVCACVQMCRRELVPILIDDVCVCVCIQGTIAKLGLQHDPTGTGEALTHIRKRLEMMLLGADGGNKCMYLCLCCVYVCVYGFFLSLSYNCVYSILDFFFFLVPFFTNQ